jgi:hypothetical protein
VHFQRYDAAAIPAGGRKPMLVSRIAVATAALVLGCTYPLSAQQAEKPKAIAMLLAVGDISSCGENGKDEDWMKYADKTAGVIREAIMAAEKATPKLPYRVIVLGDLAYADGTGDEFKCFSQRWAFDDAVKNEVMLPVPGNHEYHTLDAAPYFDHFKGNAFVNQNGKLKGYFAVNFPRSDGPWRLIGLNDNFGSAPQYDNTDRKELKEQTAWLEKDLADNKQNCVLAFWHEPTFTSGRHGHKYKTSPDAPLVKNRAMQNTFGILYRHGASVVLNGHEHNFEQFRPQNAEGKPVGDGVRLFVVGTGGKQLTADVYKNREESSEGGAFGLKRGIHGVMKILLFENRYEWDFLPIDKTKKFPLATTSGDCNKRK